MNQQDADTQVQKPLTDWGVQLAAAWEVWTDALGELLALAAQARWQGERPKAAIVRHGAELQRVQVFEAYGRARVQFYVQLLSGDLLPAHLGSEYEQHWREAWG